MSLDHSTDIARQLELAWAAGFFDGEGNTCLSLHKPSGLSYVRISISQVERENLERFVAAVGGPGRITGPHKTKWKPIYRYRCSGSYARKVLDALWPYLGRVKRDQATVALDGEKNKGGRHCSLRTTCPKGHPYDAVIRGKRDGLFARVCRTCQREHARAKRLRAAGGVLGSPPGERTQCPQGHPLSGENLYVTPKGGRSCRACRRIASNRAKRKKRLKGSRDEHLRPDDACDHRADSQADR